MPTTIASIIDWMDWAAARQLTEFSVMVDGCQITLRRDQGVAPMAAPAAAAAPAPTDTPADTPTDDPAVTAPLSGLCHLRPEAGGAPFVTPGAQVQAGQTLCIIEAMKVMTAIPAPQSGTVRDILVSDGQTVQAGAPLMRIA